MPSHRHQIVRSLKGDEVFTFLIDNQTELHITAADLKTFCGGDVAKASIRPERGAHSTAISEFPNAEFNIKPGDVVTGIQGGVNVNFSFDQIVAGVLAAMAFKPRV
jgi:hypothetical protein